MSWKTAYLETRLLSASPTGLVSILYEYATLRVQEARTGLARGDVAARSKAVLSVIAILGELESSLDHELGGEIAANLGRLYRYMRERLTTGNIQAADAPFAEVEGLLKTLGEAWSAIAQNTGAQNANAQTSVAAAGDAEAVKIPAGWSAGQMTESMSNYSAHTWSA
jgi:flagellar protein FliS